MPGAFGNLERGAMTRHSDEQLQDVVSHLDLIPRANNFQEFEVIRRAMESTMAETEAAEATIDVTTQADAD